MKVIPQSDAYRVGYDAIRWGSPIDDPFVDGPIACDVHGVVGCRSPGCAVWLSRPVSPYGGRPIGGFPVPMTFVDAERWSDGQD